MAISLIKEFKQKQKVSLTPQLKKSIDLLQLSRYELIQKIDNEIESNPFIEKEDFDDFEFKANPDDFDFEISASESLRQNLINQIEDLGLDENSRRIALLIIDSIDESGQLHDSLDELEAMMDYHETGNPRDSRLLGPGALGHLLGKFARDRDTIRARQGLYRGSMGDTRKILDLGSGGSAEPFLLSISIKE